jgi:DNA-binding MarR family transcriptional regulator
VNPASNNELGMVLMLLTQDFQRRLDADLAARGVPGIGARHRRLFLHLSRHGTSRSVDLAAEAGVTPQSMMKIVHELEQLGLVRRSPDPQDSRAKRIALTPAGRGLVRELTRSTQTVWAQYAALDGETFLNTTFQGMQRLLELIQKETRT